MTAPGTRGLTLLERHCASLDLDEPTARERLEASVGPELARVLVTALCGGRPGPRAGSLDAGPVFAA